MGKHHHRVFKSRVGAASSVDQASTRACKSYTKLPAGHLLEREPVSVRQWLGEASRLAATTNHQQEVSKCVFASSLPV